MAKVSFKKPETANASAPVADPIAAIVEEVQGAGSATTVESGGTSTDVAVRDNSAAVPAPYSGGGSDEIDLKDVILPRINIVQKVGEMSDNWPHGSIVLDNALELPRPVRILVLGFAPKAFVEKVEGGGRGQICQTEEEVNEAGGTLDYNEAQATDKPLFQRLAKALLLVEKPEGVDATAFPYEFNGKFYAFATWNLKGTSYNKGAKIFFTARKLGALRNDATGGYRSAFYTVDTAKEQYKSNTYFVPKLKLAEGSTPEFRAFAEGVVGF